MSAPKPASVMTYPLGPTNLRASLSAMIEFCPCAMFANGPVLNEFKRRMHIARRTSMHEDRRALKCLHECRTNSVTHQHGQRACHAQIIGGDRVTLTAACYYHTAESLSHVRHRCGQCKHGHDLEYDRCTHCGMQLRTSLATVISNLTVREWPCSVGA